MNEAELLVTFNADKPALKAWGDFVTAYIRGELEKQLGNELAVNKFLKVPAVPRVKDDPSLVGKAFWRGYHWGDLYDEITDKVGTRFVVLLLQDIECIKDIVEASPHWTSYKSRDFEQEAEENPTTFSYQSVHFIVRANISSPHSGIIVTAGTPCEIQIRTLLQHAYSEMSHDNIYKSQIKSSVAVHRLMARCVALIDSTDQMFKVASMEIEAAKKEYERDMDAYEQIYQETVHLQAKRDDRTSTFVLEKLQPLLFGVTVGQVREFIQSHSYLGAHIARRVSTDFLYSQPLILLLFYVADSQPDAIKQNWPYWPDHLTHLFHDLGIADR